MLLWVSVDHTVALLRFLKSLIHLRGYVQALVLVVGLETKGS